MKRVTCMLVALASLFTFFSCFQHPAMASDRNPDKGETAMRITVSSNGHAVAYALNTSQAARELYAQLPMTIEVEKYGGKEIIFYPPKKLNTEETPLVESAAPGTLAYYAPWGDVVMFYDRFGSAPGLYELGYAKSGHEFVESLSGTVRIDKYDE